MQTRRANSLLCSISSYRIEGDKAQSQNIESVIKDRLLRIGNHQRQVFLQIAREFVKVHVIKDVAQVQEIVRCSIAEETIEKQIAPADQDSNECGAGFHAWIADGLCVAIYAIQIEAAREKL